MGRKKRRASLRLKRAGSIAEGSHVQYVNGSAEFAAARLARGARSHGCRRRGRGPGRSAQSVTLLAVGKAQPSWNGSQGRRGRGRSGLRRELPPGGAALKWRRCEDATLTGISSAACSPTRPAPSPNVRVGTHRGPGSVAKRLAAQRPSHAPPLNMCLQVNVGRRKRARAACAGSSCRRSPRRGRAAALKLRGLMCLPPLGTGNARASAYWFAQLRMHLETS